MDTSIIEKQLEKVPEIIKKLFFSPDIAEGIAKIGEENGLMMDQVGDLIEQTGLMVIGLSSSRDFVKTLSNKLKIDPSVALKISTQINDQILREVKEEIQKLNSEQYDMATEAVESIQEPAKEEVVTPEPTAIETVVPQEPAVRKVDNSIVTSPNQLISSVEQAGNFTVDNSHPQSSSPQYKETNINKEELLKKIETDHVPLVDHLLTTPVSNQQTVEVKKVQDIKPQEGKAGYPMDPYKEQI